MVEEALKPMQYWLDMGVDALRLAVLYYGDWIGMDDNIYLGDRNGVRTLMQWNADGNAGLCTHSFRAAIGYVFARLRALLSKRGGKELRRLREINQDRTFHLL